MCVLMIKKKTLFKREKKNILAYCIANWPETFLLFKERTFTVYEYMESISIMCSFVCVCVFGVIVKRTMTTQLQVLACCNNDVF